MYNFLIKSGGSNEPPIALVMLLLMKRGLDENLPIYPSPPSI